MRLSYNPATARRCICCRSEGGQYQLRAVVSHFPTTGAVVLECGHLDHSIEQFIELHPTWTWEPSKESVAAVEEMLRATYDALTCTLVDDLP